jgi:hypothetical protein
MKVAVLVKFSHCAEAGDPYSEELIARVKEFNKELEKAGVMIAVERLQPSSKSKRVRISGGKELVIDGPFAETKELVGGFWLWQVKSMEEAVEWARRCPKPRNQDGELEIREVLDPSDFGPSVTPGVRE